MGLIDTVKDVATLVQKTDNIEIVKHVLALQTQALDTLAEISTLRERVRELESQLAFAGTLTFRAPLYFATGDRTPYCAKCWESERRAIHLKEDWNGTRWECFHCTSVYLLDGAPPNVGRAMTDD